ncbi:phage tail sheath subtilisin-like domain-containing protein, partial [Clostridium botulinum]|uniref:phage tail sheath subtilisin-like domain-containing protein n=1 Tax=Clostridium botulinum TaxID=1491 RepID=UPI00192E363A
SSDLISISDYELGIDYELEYTHEGYLKIIFLSEKEVPDILSITYKVIDTSAIVESDIIGTYDEKTESRTGIMAIEDVYEDLNVVPTIITAPGFNENSKVRQALVSSTKQISDKWEATAFTDIDSKSISNIDEAIKWKKTNGYNSNEEKLFWPKGVMGGKEIYLSILAIVAKMQTDVKYNNIPYQTPSNKQIDITGIIAKESIIKFSQNRANELNASGITTAIYNGGRYVLWGPHMANYEDGVTSKPDEIFDTNVFMNKYLLNDFQLRNTGIVDNA